MPNRNEKNLFFLASCIGCEVEGNIVATRQLIQEKIDCSIQLQERDKKILSLSYGLHGEGQHYYREISSILDISISRVGQLLNKAIRKIIREGKNAIFKGRIKK